MIITAPQVIDWINSYEKKANLVVNRINFTDSKEWKFTNQKSILCHQTEGFFSIVGLKFRSNFYTDHIFNQPIIDQPEIGILGFLAQIIDGQLCLLAQAKTEPGNVNIVQLGPTLQATESNYKGLHGGTIPLFLEYFQNPQKHIILVDQLQSEQGTRFLKKRNRNMVIILSNTIHIEETENHKWVPLPVWKKLMAQDHLVNTDSRSVIASLVYSGHSIINDSFSADDNFSQDLKYSLQEQKNSKQNFADTISWITKLKSFYTLQTELIPLHALAGWNITDQEISHDSLNYFSVYQYKVQCQSREVSLWDQPLICTHEAGLQGLICKKIDGVLHFLIQAKVEPGHFDKIELTSSVHLSIGDYDGHRKTDFIEFLDTGTLIMEGIDSEEGGRFYKDENRYKIVQIDESHNPDLPINYRWLTLHQLSNLIFFNNLLTNELRSVLALMFSKF